MNILFKLPKGKGDPRKDERYTVATPNIQDWDIRYNLIFNDGECYWWVSECQIPPQIGWTIYPPVSPFELTNNGRPVIVSGIEYWCLALVQIVVNCRTSC